MGTLSDVFRAGLITEDGFIGEVGRDLNLAQEAVGSEGRSQFWAQNFYGDLAFVLEILGEIDGGHSAGAELALDLVPIREC